MSIYLTTIWGLEFCFWCRSLSAVWYCTNCWHVWRSEFNVQCEEHICKRLTWAPQCTVLQTHTRTISLC